MLELSGAQVIQLIHSQPENYGPIDGIVIYHDQHMASMLLVSLAATRVVLLTGKNLDEAREFHYNQCVEFPKHRINTIVFRDASKSATKIAEKTAFLFSDAARTIHRQIFEV